MNSAQQALLAALKASDRAADEAKNNLSTHAQQLFEYESAQATFRQTLRNEGLDVDRVTKLEDQVFLELYLSR